MLPLLTNLDTTGEAMDQLTDRATRRGAEEVVQFFADTGQTHVFGLPGSSMVSLLHALQSAEVSYVPAVHESVAIAMADGYARITGLGSALIYMLPGTANAVGNLYNAWRDESPLLVLASQQATRFRTGDATIGEANLVDLVGCYTRFASEVNAGAPIRARLEAARRAAQGPPSGPAFLSLPEDVLEDDGPAVEERRSRRVAGGPPDVSVVVSQLLTAESPLVVVGGQLRRFGGANAIERLAAELALPVVYETAFNDRLSIGPGHPNCLGRLGDATGAHLETGADAVIAVGCRHVLEAHPRAKPWFANASFVAHVNADAAKLEETAPTDWSCACDPAQFVNAVREAVLASPIDLALLQRRQRRLDDARRSKIARRRTPYSDGAAALSDALDRGWVIDESVTASGEVTDALSSEDGTRFMSSTGASLGWATGAACGAAVASSEPVTCVLGDGSLLFGVQGLWTARACDLPITFVVFDNGGYGSTRRFERQYVDRLPAGSRPAGYLGSDHRPFGLSPADVIRGFGIPCQSIKSGEDIRAAIDEAWATIENGPNAVVIDTPVTG